MGDNCFCIAWVSKCTGHPLRWRQFALAAVSFVVPETDDDPELGNPHIVPIVRAPNGVILTIVSALNGRQNAQDTLALETVYPCCSFLCGSRDGRSSPVGQSTRFANCLRVEKVSSLHRTPWFVLETVCHVCADAGSPHRYDGGGRLECVLLGPLE